MLWMEGNYSVDMKGLKLLFAYGDFGSFGTLTNELKGTSKGDKLLAQEDGGVEYFGGC